MRQVLFDILSNFAWEPEFPDPGMFIDTLQLGDVITGNEYDSIRNKTSRIERIVETLNIMKRKTDQAYYALTDIFSSNVWALASRMVEPLRVINGDNHGFGSAYEGIPILSDLMERRKEIFFNTGKVETFPDPLEYLDELEERNLISPAQRKEIETSGSKFNRELNLFSILRFDAASNYHAYQDMIDIFKKKGYPAADILVSERQIIFDKYYHEEKEDKSKDKFELVDDSQILATIYVAYPNDGQKTKSQMPNNEAQLNQFIYDKLKKAEASLKGGENSPNDENLENPTLQKGSPRVKSREGPINERKLGFSKAEITSLARWLHHFGLISKSDHESLLESPGNTFEDRDGKIFDVIRSKKEKKDKVIRGRLFPALILRLAQQTESKNEFDSLQALANEIILEEYRDFPDWDDDGVLAHLNILGEGGFGLVCTGLLDNKVVAVKTARVSNISFHLEELFQGEFSTLRNLSHRNIVEFRQRTHVEGEKPFYVMEYVPAGTLDRFWTEPTGRNFAEKITQDTKLSIAKQLWDGVAYLHGKNIVHQDIKPGNVLVTFDYVPKLCDFGFSKFVADLSRSESSVSNHNPGTRKYNPPEIELGSKRIRDSKVDIWMAGITIMYLFCEKFLFGDFYGEIEQAQISRACAMHRLPLEPPETGEKLIELKEFDLIALYIVNKRYVEAKQHYECAADDVHDVLKGMWDNFHVSVTDIVALEFLFYRYSRNLDARKSYPEWKASVLETGALLELLNDKWYEGFEDESRYRLRHEFESLNYVELPSYPEKIYSWKDFRESYPEVAIRNGLNFIDSRFNSDKSRDSYEQSRIPRVQLPPSMSSTSTNPESTTQSQSPSSPTEKEKDKVQTSQGSTSTEIVTESELSEGYDCENLPTDGSEEDETNEEVNEPAIGTRPVRSMTLETGDETRKAGQKKSSAAASRDDRRQGTVVNRNDPACPVQPRISDHGQPEGIPAESAAPLHGSNPSSVPEGKSKPADHMDYGRRILAITPVNLVTIESVVTPLLPLPSGDAHLKPPGESPDDDDKTTTCSSTDAEHLTTGDETALITTPPSWNVENAKTLLALYRLATGPFGMIFEMERWSRVSADLPVSVGNFAWTDERISKLAEDISISPSNLEQLQEYDTDPNRRESDGEIMNQIKSFFKCTAQLNSLEDDSPLLLQNFPSVINLASHPTESWDRNLVLQLGLRPLKWRYTARPRASEMQQIFFEELEKRHRV